MLFLCFVKLSYVEKDMIKYFFKYKQKTKKKAKHNIMLYYVILWHIMLYFYAMLC